jgi:hypothetical protein
MSEYPPAADFTVAYNIPDDAAGADMEVEICDYRIVRTAHRVPPFSLDEHDAIDALTDKTVRRYLKQTRHRKWDELHDYVWSLPSIGDAKGERSLEIVVEPRMLTHRFVEELQDNVLGCFPLWRIRITQYSDRPDLAVAVYPDAVSIGTESFRGSKDIKQRIDELRNVLEAMRLDSIKYRLRQFKHVCWLVPEVMKAMSSGPITVVAAFDNHDGDFSEQAVWLLQTDVVTSASPVPDGDEVVTGETYPVSDRGSVGPRFHRGSAPLWLQEWIFPLALPRTITLREVEGSNIYDARIERTISDEELRVREG